MKNLIYIIIAIVIIVLLVVFVGGGSDKPKLSGETESFEVLMGETGGVLGLEINPIEVLEDSRCQVDVECVWEGTLRMRANIILDGSDVPSTVHIFELNKISEVEGKEVLLYEVMPEAHSQNAIDLGDYLFKFEVGK